MVNIDLSGNYLTQLAPTHHKRQAQKKQQPSSRKQSAYEEGEKPDVAAHRSGLGFVHFTQALTSHAAEGRKSLIRLELSDNDLSCCPTPLQQLLNFHRSSLRVVSLGNCRVSKMLISFSLIISSPVI